MEDQDLAKFQSKQIIKKRSATPWLVVMFCVILAAGLILAAQKLYFFYLSAPGTDSKSYVFMIDEGESAKIIATNLYRQGFIRSDLFFRWWVKKEKLSLQAGEYSFSKNVPLPDLAQALTHGISDTRITFLEGWRREQIAEEILANRNLPEIVTSDMTQAEKETWLENFLSQTQEGYLFPDTYTLPKKSSLSDLIGFMQENFWVQFSLELRDQAAQKDMTMDEVVILASIVERETKNAEDRTLVAGILVKRLKNDWPLEADATVQYAKAERTCKGEELGCEWWAEELTQEDLETDSPYNTRKYKGLPPTPICSPSFSSLEAVVNFQESDWWYYLSGQDGKMHYAKTLEEHNRNSAQFL